MINAGREPEKVFLCRRRSSKMRPRNCAQMVQINRDRSAVSVRPPLISSTRSWRAAAAMAVVVVRVLFFGPPSLGLTKRRNERMVASSSHPLLEAAPALVSSILHPHNIGVPLSPSHPHQGWVIWCLQPLGERATLRARGLA